MLSNGAVCSVAYYQPNIFRLHAVCNKADMLKFLHYSYFGSASMLIVIVFFQVHGTNDN